MRARKPSMDASQTRQEYKFLLSAQVARPVREEVASRLPADQGAAEGYPILSEYYDSEDLQSYWNKHFGVASRRRVRTRVYGDPDSDREPTAFIEIKHRLDDIAVKRRVQVGLDDIEEFGNGSLPSRNCPQDRKVLREITALLNNLSTQPVLKIRYHRHAYDSGPEGTLRVTFDHEPACCFPDPDSSERPLLETGEVIMEVKTIGAVPYWFRQLIGKYRLVPRRFSKYTTALERYGFNQPI